MSDNIQKKKGMQFLKVPYELLYLIGTYNVDGNKIKIDALDILILSKIQEFLDFDKNCFISDDNFAKLFHVSRSTVQRSIKNLKALEFIKSETYMVTDCGQQTKRRNLFINQDTINKAISDNRAGVKFKVSKRQNDIKQASDLQEASVNVGAITENKKKNNKKIKENNCLFIPNGIKNLMDEIGISYQENTENELKKIIGKDIDYDILQRIIEKNKQSFLKHKNNGQNYLFGILKTIVKNQYEEYIKKLETERIEREVEIRKWMEEPKIDYNRIGSCVSAQQENDGIDISAMLDEIYKDNNDENTDCDGVTISEDDAESGVYASKSLQILYGLKSLSTQTC